MDNEKEESRTINPDSESLSPPQSAQGLNTENTTGVMPTSNEYQPGFAQQQATRPSGKNRRVYLIIVIAIALAGSAVSLGFILNNKKSDLAVDSPQTTVNKLSDNTASGSIVGNVIEIDLSDFSTEEAPLNLPSPYQNSESFKNNNSLISLQIVQPADDRPKCFEEFKLNCEVSTFLKTAYKGTYKRSITGGKVTGSPVGDLYISSGTVFPDEPATSVVSVVGFSTNSPDQVILLSFIAPGSNISPEKQFDEFYKKLQPILTKIINSLST